MKKNPFPSMKYLSLFITMTSFALLLAGCRGNTMRAVIPGPVPQNASFAFVANMNSNTISGFSLDPRSGALSPLVGSPFAVGTGPEFMAADPTGKFLVVANSGSGDVSVFQITSQTGTLTAVPGSPFPAGTRPEGVAVDPGGKFVFVANQASNSISVFNLAANGWLSPAPGSPFPAAHPFGLAVNPSGKVLYANNFPDSMAADLNTVSTFQIASNGALTPLAGSPSATANSPGFASSIGMAVDPQGKFLFVADHMAQAIVPFDIAASTGALTPASALPTPAASCGVGCHNNSLRVTVHPNDQFVYATNVQAGTVSAFSIVTGGMSHIADFSTGQHPFGIAVDPSGSFLYVANKVDNNVSAFSVSTSTGMLSPLNGSPVRTGNAPTDMVIVAGH
jgi:DNA-binding beta-propeller fold protein YncE